MVKHSASSKKHDARTNDTKTLKHQQESKIINIQYDETNNKMMNSGGDRIKPCMLLSGQRAYLLMGGGLRRLAMDSKIRNPAKGVWCENKN